MRHNTITAAMLDETTYEQTADQHGAFLVSVDDGTPCINLTCLAASVQVEDEWHAALVTDLHERGSHSARVFCLTRKTDAFVVIVGDDIAGLDGAYWRLEQAPGEPLEAFRKRVWSKHAQVMHDHVAAC